MKDEPNGPTPHDWPEDWPHNNGMYLGRCRSCGAQFIGHKRRMTCRVCAADSLERENEVLRIERDHARAQYDMAAKQLAGIWHLLSPDDVTVGDKTYRFVDPNANETLRELTRRIKEIPEPLRTPSTNEK
jgi:hypothetical protein